MEGIELIKFFNENSNGITAFAAIGALIISAMAIKRATNDNRKQVLAHKIEEIYELLVSLTAEYVSLYSVYKHLEASNNIELESKARFNLRAHFFDLNGKLKEKINLDDLIKKSRRLNILANTYLNGETKFDVICYSQILIAILFVLKYENIKQREPEFNEPLPNEDTMYNLSEGLTQKLIVEIGYGNVNKDFLTYRNTTFKDKIKEISQAISINQTTTH
ncbi:hypothetical protein IR010_05650 [Flavobacterium sp. MR2016-29]|uniref:hypothetical protein n=1 Tax=Flavobacterium sp. MR2016-29 TaxID=2783795 RepID=UPI001889F141|nr:hypothetical protein [Flavobacterium sp. MR2016-29]MBF4492021.1 hypothetical protein [Flavobacterium sp. MR2016-29]